jgi:hypothetical protein
LVEFHDKKIVFDSFEIEIRVTAPCNNRSVFGVILLGAACAYQHTAAGDVDAVSSR